jgi:hypothetical protein
MKDLRRPGFGPAWKGGARVSAVRGLLTAALAGLGLLLPGDPAAAQEAAPAEEAAPAQEDDPLIGGKPLSELVKQLRSENKGLQLRAAKVLVEAPAELRPKMIPKMTELLKSERENDKYVAAQVLGQCGPAAKAAVPDLLPLLEGTQYERNRAAAAKALGQILKDAQPGDEVEKVTKALVAVYDDKYSDVRREAITACGVIGPAAKSCIPRLPAKLDDREGEFILVQKAAAWTCGRMGPLAAGHMDKLISVMHDRTYPQVPEAIGWIGPVNENVAKNIAARMEKVMYTKDYLLYEEERDRYLPACLAALEKFGPKAKAAVPLIDRCLREGEWYYPHSFEWAIGGVKVLRAVGPEAKEALPTLEKAVQKAPFDGRISKEKVAEFKKEAQAALEAVKGTGK